jgi:hypothetical protein
MVDLNSPVPLDPANAGTPAVKIPQVSYTHTNQSPVAIPKPTDVLSFAADGKSKTGASA